MIKNAVVDTSRMLTTVMGVAGCTTLLVISFTLLLDTKDDSLEENAVKIKFDPTDTIFDVSARVKKAIVENRKADEPGFLIKLASFLLRVPGLANLVVGLVKLLDRYGICPKALIDFLPFHCSMFITNMASIGMTRVYHHIYNFGNTSLFMSLGTPIRSNAVNKDGSVYRKAILPIGMTADERVCGGAMYARLFAHMKRILNHPEELELPPEEVLQDID